MTINRRIGPEIIELSRQFPVITITGPRQSGKTTLAQMLFPDTAYANLEDMQQRDFALNDPKGFLEQFPNGAVIDEIQRAPDLCSYIQVTVDQKKKNGLFILTGSHQFEMISKISQSLAGRTAIIRLLPFDLKEAYPSINQNSKLLDILYTGFYPRIFSDNINPSKFYSFYVSTYIERDLRQIINIKDLSRFETFIRLCAGRIGQIINYTSISNECGVDQNTIKSWLSVLEASYICRLLKPYYKNIGKRLVKAPKIYFYDSGLVCFLLGITNPEHLRNHPLFGNIFENFIVSEIIKNIFNKV
ncbi:MAG: ATP-binding protein, partial [Spirochaetia bacterium]